MTPGAEMDALIAEKVMGLTGPREHSVVDEDCGDMRCCVCGQGWRINEPEPSGCVPRYSTNIAAAWQIIDRFQAGWDPRLEYTAGAGWEAKLWPSGLDPVGPILCETAPEAICLAALAAFGVAFE